MRVLVIAHDIEVGGAFRSLLNNIFELSLINDVELVVCTVRKGNLNKYCDDWKIENYVTGHGTFMVGGGSTKIRHFIRILTQPLLRMNYLRRNYFAQKKIFKYVNPKNIDMIYSNLNRNDIGAILSQKYNIPHIWHIREYGELDFGCITLKNNYIEYMKQGAVYFIANSVSVANYWINKGLPREKIITIYNGIDTKKIFTTPRPKNNNRIYIIQMGAIHHNKGQHELIEAIGLLPDCLKEKICVDFYGNGAVEYVKKLKKIIRIKKLDAIFNFKGYKKDIISELPKYDIGIMASKSEAFGLVTIEEMLAGLAVIGSNTGATPEIIIDGQCGLIYEQGNTNDLCEKLKILIMQENMRKQIGKTARQRVIQYFSREQTPLNIYNVFIKCEEMKVQR